jgi:hypothetical protein
MERGAAERHLVAAFRLTEDEAAALVTESTVSVSGMAQFPRPGLPPRTLWVTHMTTLDGKFIVEVA